jgi:hypothetical protein
MCRNVRDEVATAQAEAARDGGRMIEVAKVRITDSGPKAPGQT